MTDQDASGRSGRRGPSDEQLRQATPPAAGGREVQVGLFVIVGIVATLTVLFLLTDPATFRGRYLVMTEVDDAGGVRRGDPVQMRGVNVGRVRDFQMVSEGVVMTLEIDGRWRLPEDSYTRVTGLGLLGGRTIEVVPGDSEAMLPERGLLRGERTEDLTDLAGVLGRDVETIVDRLQHLLADTTVAAVAGTASDTRRLVADLSVTVAEQREELARISASLRRSAEDLEGTLAGPELARTLARADSAMARLHTSGAALERASTSLEAVVGRMERGEGTLGLLSTDEELYHNLNRAAEAMVLLAEDVRENPGRYIRLRIF